MSCGSWAHARRPGFFSRHRFHRGDHREEGNFMGPEGFGVRRPLRFLAHRLELSEPQIVELGRILDALKIERAQVEVDNRRALSGFADALAGETFDAAKATEAGERRVSSAQRLRETLIK